MLIHLIDEIIRDQESDGRLCFSVWLPPTLAKTSKPNSLDPSSSRSSSNSLKLPVNLARSLVSGQMAGTQSIYQEKKINRR